MESNSTKITVLLAEYNTLRSEVLAARGYMIVSFNILVTATLTLLGLFVSNMIQFGIVNYILIQSLLLLFISITLFWNNYNTRKFTKRIREIEKKINLLAGEKLLIWETQSGWGDMYQIHNEQYKSYSQQANDNKYFIKFNEILINNIIHLSIIILLSYGIFWYIIQKIFNWVYDTGQYGILPHGGSALFLSLSMTIAIMLSPFFYEKFTAKKHITKSHWFACIAIIVVNCLTNLIIYGASSFPGTANLILPLFNVLNKSISYPNQTLLLLQTTNE